VDEDRLGDPGFDQVVQRLEHSNATAPTYLPEASDACMACYSVGVSVVMVSRALVEIHLAETIADSIRAAQRWPDARIRGVHLVKNRDGKAALVCVNLGYRPIAIVNPPRTMDSSVFDAAVDFLRAMPDHLTHGNVSERWFPPRDDGSPAVLGVGLAEMYRAWRRAALMEQSAIFEPGWVLRDVPISPIGRFHGDPRYYLSADLAAGMKPSLQDDLDAIHQVYQTLGRTNTAGDLPHNDPLRQMTVTGPDLLKRALASGRLLTSNAPAPSSVRGLRRYWMLIGAILGLGAILVTAGKLAHFSKRTPAPDSIHVRDALMDRDLPLTSNDVPSVIQPPPAPSCPMCPPGILDSTLIGKSSRITYQIDGDFLSDDSHIKKGRRSSVLKKTFMNSDKPYEADATYSVSFKLNEPRIIEAEVEGKEGAKEKVHLLLVDRSSDGEKELCWSLTKLGDVKKESSLCPQKFVENGKETPILLQQGEYALLVLDAPDKPGSEGCVTTSEKKSKKDAKQPPCAFTLTFTLIKP